jgi:hypothetical protein
VKEFAEQEIGPKERASNVATCLLQGLEACSRLEEVPVHQKAVLMKLAHIGVRQRRNSWEETKLQWKGFDTTHDCDTSDEYSHEGQHELARHAPIRNVFGGCCSCFVQWHGHLNSNVGHEDMVNL